MKLFLHTIINPTLDSVEDPTFKAQYIMSLLSISYKLFPHWKRKDKNIQTAEIFQTCL